MQLISKFIIIGVVFFASIEGASSQEVCRIDGSEFTTVAANAGHNISFSHMTGGGGCRIESNSVVVGANQELDTTCNFTFFSGLVFDQGIKIKRVEFTKPFDFVSKFSERNLQFAIKVEAKRGTSVSLTLANIVIEGNHCNDWRTLF